MLGNYKEKKEIDDIFGSLDYNYKKKKREEEDKVIEYNYIK